MEDVIYKVNLDGTKLLHKVIVRIPDSVPEAFPALFRSVDPDYFKVSSPYSWYVNQIGSVGLHKLGVYSTKVFNPVKI